MKKVNIPGFENKEVSYIESISYSALSVEA